MLFTVSSKVILKTILLHDGIKVSSVPQVKEVNMTETRVPSGFAAKIRYEEHRLDHVLP